MTDEPVENPPSETPAVVVGSDGKSYPSKEEHRKRLDLVRKLIQAGMYDGQIRAAVAKEFGCSRKTVFRYIAIVRKEVQAEYTQEESERHRADSLEFYRGIFSNPKLPTQARIRARENMDKLLGLAVPEVRLVQTVDISLRASIENLARQQLTEDELSKLIEASEIAKRIGETDEDGGD